MPSDHVLQRNPAINDIVWKPVTEHAEYSRRDPISAPSLSL
jgi:hypothetical protein